MLWEPRAPTPMQLWPAGVVTVGSPLLAFPAQKLEVTSRETEPHSDIYFKADSSRRRGVQYIHSFYQTSIHGAPMNCQTPSEAPEAKAGQSPCTLGGSCSTEGASVRTVCRGLNFPCALGLSGIWQSSGPSL